MHAMEIVPLSPALGAEIRGVDALRPVSEEAFRQIEKAWHEHLVSRRRGKDLAEKQQVRFAERFGPLSPIHTEHRAEKNKAVIYIGNRKKDGRLVGALPLGEMQFHR